MKNKNFFKAVVLIFFTLAIALVMCSCGQPITKEEKAKLESEITSLNEQVRAAQINRDIYEEQVKAELDKLTTLNEKLAVLETKLGIVENGKTPKYILKLKFQEHKFELSIDRISFEFEVPVDEQFYNESTIGSELGEGSRSFSLGHSADVTVIGKRIE